MRVSNQDCFSLCAALLSTSDDPWGVTLPCDPSFLICLLVLPTSFLSLLLTSPSIAYSPLPPSMKVVCQYALPQWPISLVLLIRSTRAVCHHALPKWSVFPKYMPSILQEKFNNYRWLHCSTSAGLTVECVVAFKCTYFDHSMNLLML